MVCMKSTSSYESCSHMTHAGREWIQYYNCTRGLHDNCVDDHEAYTYGNHVP